MGGGPHFSAGRIRRGGARPSDNPPCPAAGWLKSNPRPKRICTRSGTKATAMTSNRTPGTEWYPSLCRTTASEPDTASPRPPSHHTDARHRPSDPVEDDTGGGAIHDDTRDHLPAVVPTLAELTDLGDPCLVGEDCRAHAGPDLSSSAAWRSASSAPHPDLAVSTTAGYHLGQPSRSLRFRAPPHRGRRPSDPRRGLEPATPPV